MTASNGADAWQRLGEMLIQRRTALDPRFHNRSVFCEATGLKYRLVYDIEEARRTNFGGSTLAAIEAAYRLAPGAISRFLAGGQIEPQGGPPPPPPPGPRRIRDFARVEDEEGLQPFISDVRRDLYAAVGAKFPPGREVPEMPELEKVLATLPGEVELTVGYEAELWDTPEQTQVEKVRMIAILRRMLAEGIAERDRRAV